ncbi:MAG: ribosome biogenesis GTPase Der [Terriglobia bacterium]
MNKGSKLPSVAIVGRPNVGKSTLFNRISGRRRSLVGNEPGMTRDRIYAHAEWCGKVFDVIDTGGLIPRDKDLMAAAIFAQARTAMDEAAEWILVLDGKAGLASVDTELAALLRRQGKPLTLAVNKIDSPQAEPLLADFYRTGIRDVFPISAEHALGIDDLLDHITRNFPAGEAESHESDEAGDAAIRVAIIGRPNVGKSTLLNRLVGEERSIVMPLPGTTRDAVDAEIETGDQRFVFIDTAGIRRKGKTRQLAEKLSVIQARKHLEGADVALLLLDATEGVTALDTHIGGYAHTSHRSVIVVVNKWDAVEKGPATTTEFERGVRNRLKYLDYAPLIFISALSGQRVKRLPGIIADAAAARRKRVTTSEMNRFLAGLNFDRVPSPGSKPLRLYYLTQAGTAPPTFVAFTNRAGPLYFSVERFLENRIRERFGFAASPIVIKARLRGKP